MFCGFLYKIYGNFSLCNNWNRSGSKEDPAESLPIYLKRTKNMKFGTCITNWNNVTLIFRTKISHASFTPVNSRRWRIRRQTFDVSWKTKVILCWVYNGRSKDGDFVTGVCFWLLETIRNSTEIFSVLFFNFPYHYRDSLL